MLLMCFFFVLQENMPPRFDPLRLALLDQPDRSLATNVEVTAATESTITRSSNRSVEAELRVPCARNEMRGNCSDISEQEEAQDFEVHREFRAYGQAAALFVELGAYRGGPDTFAVVGLAAKPIHVFANAGFECEWIPATTFDSSSSSSAVKGRAEKMLPDWNMGRQYTVVVVNCSFAERVGVDGNGGQLILYASYGDGIKIKPAERIVAMEEKQGQYDENFFKPPYPYDFVYCGSSLFGSINPQRIREWMAYHVNLFGKRSHFFFHDSTGAVNDGVRKVLQPWKELGYVTVHDIKQEQQYDGYYHNQFLIVNDCHHRTRFLSNWTFFFDVDEYLYVPPGESLHSVMDGLSNYTQVIFEQKPMSSKLCYSKRNKSSRGWGFEKLVYRNVQKGITWDRKYAIQPRNVLTTGVHRSDHMVGLSLGYDPESHVPKLRYYHYHDTITQSDDPLCQEFANSSQIVDSNKVPFTLDTGMQRLAKSVKKFELEQIGPQPTVMS